MFSRSCQFDDSFQLIYHLVIHYGILMAVELFFNLFILIGMSPFPLQTCTYQTKQKTTMMAWSSAETTTLTTTTTLTITSAMVISTALSKTAATMSTTIITLLVLCTFLVFVLEGFWTPYFVTF